jgi:hypothetical protein
VPQSVSPEHDLEHIGERKLASAGKVRRAGRAAPPRQSSPAHRPRQWPSL